MMAVRDIEIWNFRKLRFDLLNGFLISNGPRRMTHAIGGGEIDVGLSGGDFREKSIENGNGAVSEKNRTGLRVERFDMAHAVVFFVRAGEFVLSDSIVQIFLAT